MRGKQVNLAWHVRGTFGPMLERFTVQRRLSGGGTSTPTFVLNLRVFIGVIGLTDGAIGRIPSVDREPTDDTVQTLITNTRPVMIQLQPRRCGVACRLSILCVVVFLVNPPVNVPAQP
jgi:hypothetical protein